MTNDSELDRLDLLARLDGLLGRVRDWCGREDRWQPVEDGRALLRRVLGRAEAVRVRLESPLVVATFGGTGVGKSTLVNALVGEEVSAGGKQRPTTTTPTLVVHPDTDPAALGLPLDQVRVKTADARVLRDFVLLDCPDPDTTETGTEGEGGATNLGRLRALLPHSDVLLVVSTQQKYRNARVLDELRDAARGCRLLFVQTNAAHDSDVREDWRSVLTGPQPGGGYDVAADDLFFVDSLRAQRERDEGRLPTGEFARLLETLRTELAEHARVRVRRANLLDLLCGALDRAAAGVAETRPKLDAVSAQLAAERAALTDAMTGRLREELLGNSGLWERRLADAVATEWGASPFSITLRFYNGLGGYISQSSLFRARNAAAVALIGATEVGRRLKERQQGRAADDRLDRLEQSRLGAFGDDDGLVRDARFRLAGHVRDARLPEALLDLSEEELGERAAAVEGRFLDGARRRVDDLIGRLAAANSRPWVRYGYEAALLSLPAVILLRAAKNFFWDSFLAPAFLDVPDEPVYGGDFWIAAAVFASLWAGLWVALFCRRLRRGLGREVRELTASLARRQMPAGPFPQLERATEEAAAAADRLARLREEADAARQMLTAPAGLAGPGR